MVSQKTKKPSQEVETKQRKQAKMRGETCQIKKTNIINLTGPLAGQSNECTAANKSV